MMGRDFWAIYIFLVGRWVEITPEYIEDGVRWRSNSLLGRCLAVKAGKQHRFLWLIDRKLYICLIDCIKAYDLLNHEMLWVHMKLIGFSEYLIALIRSLYENQVVYSKNRIWKYWVDWIELEKDASGMYILSSYLFDLHTEIIMRDALKGLNMIVRIGGRIVNSLKYADNTTFWSETENELRPFIKRDENESEALKLHLYIQYKGKINYDRWH